MGRRRRSDRVHGPREVRVRGESRWEITAWIGGERYRSYHPTPQDAQRELRILTSQIRAGAWDRPATWEEAIDAYLEHRASKGTTPRSLTTQRYRLEAVERVVGGDPLALSSKDAERHLAARRGAGIADGTLAGEVAAIVSMQRWAVGRGWLRTASWAEVTRPRVPARERYLRPHEVGIFLRAAEALGATPPGQGRDVDWLRWPAAAWLLCHGVCVGELRYLLVRDVDLLSRVVWIREGTKTDRRRRVVQLVSEGAVACLARTFRGADPAELAFATRSGGQHRHDTRWFRSRCAATCEHAGVAIVSPHDLRHSAATAAAIRGAELRSLGHLLGHADPGVTERTYIHTATGPAAGAAAVVGAWLDAVYAGQPPVLEVVE
jgi:integrase